MGFLSITGTILIIIGVLTTLIAYLTITLTIDTNHTNWIKQTLTPTTTPTNNNRINTYIDLTVKLPIHFLNTINLIKAEYIHIIQPNRIGKVNDEYVRVKGNLQSETSFLSPFTGTESVITSLKIERNTNNQWETVYHGKQQTDDVYVSDGSGTLDINMNDINPQNITWTHDTHTTQETINWDSDKETRIKQWYEYKHALPFDQDTFNNYIQLGGLRITEHAFQHGDEIIITGDAIEYANEYGWQHEIVPNESYPFQIGGTNKNTVQTHAQLTTNKSLFKTGLACITTGSTIYILSLILTIL